VYRVSRFCSSVGTCQRVHGVRNSALAKGKRFCQIVRPFGRSVELSSGGLLGRLPRPPRPRRLVAASRPCWPRRPPAHPRRRAHGASSSPELCSVDTVRRTVLLVDLGPDDDVADSSLGIDRFMSEARAVTNFAGKRWRSWRSAPGGSPAIRQHLRIAAGRRNRTGRSSARSVGLASSLGPDTGMSSGRAAAARRGPRP
jgi:hypothetical protein